MFPAVFLVMFGVVEEVVMSSNPFIVAAERKAMYARRDRQNAMSPYLMGHSLVNSLQPMMPHQSPHFGSFASNNVSLHKNVLKFFYFNISMIQK